MVGDGDAPLVLRHATYLRANLSRRGDLLARLVASVDIGAGIRGIGQPAQHAPGGEASPNQPAVPGTAICTARETQTEFVETFDHGIGRPFALEQLEHGANGALYFLIGVEHNLVALIHITHGHRELERTFARLVEL